MTNLWAMRVLTVHFLRLFILSERPQKVNKGKCAIFIPLTLNVLLANGTTQMPGIT